jgi:SAM-dependent methyltransferase
VQRELAWYDQESYRRTRLNDILYQAPAFDAVINSGFAFLEPQTGEWILDFGGGEGKESLELLRQGLIVVNTDLSSTQLQRAQNLVQSREPSARLYSIQADAEHLPFANGTFRIIYGKAILHHLDIRKAALEINRILPEGGKATFAEPMADHPVFSFFRKLTPTLRTIDEHPFTEKASIEFVGYFDEAHTTTHFLFAPAAFAIRILPGGEKAFRWVLHWLQKLDEALFMRFPKLRKWAWYCVVNVQKLCRQQARQFDSSKHQ